MPELEKDFSAAVLEYAAFLGWVHYTIARSDRAGLRGRSGVGWPDAVLIHDEYPHDNRLLAFEFKTGKRVSTPPQRAWLALFDRVPGCEAFVVRPDRPPMDEAWHRILTVDDCGNFGQAGKCLRGEDYD